MCMSKGRHLVISSSYHTNISFIISPFSYNTMHSSWLVTSYSCPPFTMLMWSYHWQSRYPFTLVTLWECTYNNPQHTSGYCCNYCFEKWSTCLERGLPPFPSPHLTTNGYPYHQIQLPNFDGRYHYWLDLHIYGAANINNNSTCKDDGCLRENSILHQTNIKWWLYSPCY
jgi:hypothetical protein